MSNTFMQNHLNNNIYTQKYDYNKLLFYSFKWCFFLVELLIKMEIRILKQLSVSLISTC